MPEPPTALRASASESVSGCSYGCIISMARRAKSGAGTTVVLSGFGRVRISAVTSSLRNPGTFQSNRSSQDNDPIMGSGIRTLTPSSSSPGSNLYVSSRSVEWARHRSGKSSSLMVCASGWRSLSGSKSRRCGSFFDSFFHHASKWRPVVTEVGIRES